MISTVQATRFPELPGVVIHFMETGAAERALVRVDPNGSIPLHKHEVDATMYVTGGSGKVLSDTLDNGRVVGPGDCVFFAKHGPHGFQAGPEGLVFMSFNGGIRQPDGSIDLELQ
jgi:quercetin dioxygenase-like cupin family protein